MFLQYLTILWMLLFAVEGRSAVKRSEDNCKNGTNSSVDIYDCTDLLTAFVIFRHGDRTPDEKEIEKYPLAKLNNSVFFPYGIGALTNQGKQRAYLVGEYLQSRYKGFISSLYLPNEVTIRSTEFDRTKMTALCVLAALYPPQQSQKWNHKLDWQPIPYYTLPLKEDDLNIYESCPLFLRLKDEAVNRPDVYSILEDNRFLFKLLSERTGYNFETPSDVYFFRNLLQSLENVGICIPKWAENIRSNITEISILNFFWQFSSEDMIRLSSGVFIGDVINTSNAVISSDEDHTKLYLYSAHDITIASILSALKVYKPHIPAYGSSVSLELRKYRHCDKYGFTVVYAPQAGGPGEILPIAECGGQPICNYDTFVKIMRSNVLTRAEFKKQCYGSE